MGQGGGEGNYGKGKDRSWYSVRVFFIPACNLCLFLKQTCKETKDVSALTKAADFVKAFILGFQVEVSDLMTFEIEA